MRQVLLLLVLMLTSIPAWAQVDPVYQPPARPQSRTNQAITMTRDLYQRLILVENPESIAATLSEILRRNSRPCTAVTDFQVIYREGSEQRVKLKCPGLPLYGLAINQGGSTQVYGGDGMVGEFNAGNGVIHAVGGAPRPIATPDRRKPDFGPNGNLPGLLQGDDASAIPAWLVTLIIVNGFIVFALILSFFWFMRAKTTPQRAKKERTPDRSTGEKDAMVIESKEILPDIFQHPDGLFIARGKRGKRRLFRSLFSAIVYRDYGWKFREVS